MELPSELKDLTANNVQEVEKQVEPEKVQADEQKVDVVEQQPVATIKDEDVFKYLSEKRGKEIKSFEDLVEVREVVKEAEIDDEEVAEILKFKKEIGGSVTDYLQSKKDWKNEDATIVAREYLHSKYPMLTDEEVDFKLENEFLIGVDTSDYDQRVIKNASIAYKQFVSEGRSFLEDRKKQFSVPKRENKDEVLNKTRDAWKNAAVEAVKSIDGINVVDDFKFALNDKQGLEKKYDSLESVLNRFKDDKGTIDFRKMISVIEAGENISTIANAVKEAERTKALEEFMRERKNHEPEVVRNVPPKTINPQAESALSLIGKRYIK